MAWSYDAATNLMTQTGVDADLSGLAAFPHVTVTTLAGHKVYDIGVNAVEVQGDLSHDPDVEMLVSSWTGGVRPSWFITGTYRFGVETTVNGRINRSTGTGLLFIGQDTHGQAPWRPNLWGGIMITGGTMIARGGVIISDRSHGFGGAWSVDVEDTIFVRSPETLSRREFRFDNKPGSTSVFRGQIYGGFQLTHRDITGLTLSPSISDGSINQLSGSPAANFLINLGTSNNLAVQDLGTDSANDIIRWYYLTNASDGSGVRCMPKEGVGDLRQLGGVVLSKEMAFRIVDPAGAPLESVRVFTRDTDNGFRKNANGEDHLADKVYNNVTDALGTTSFEVVTAVTNIDSQGPGWSTSDWDTLAFNARYKVDRRGLDDTTDDRFEYRFFSYGHLFASSTISTKGLGVLEVAWTLFDDTTVTEPDKTVVDGWTVLNDARALYDRAKSELWDTYNGETSLIVTRAGDTASVPGSIVLDSTAVPAYARTGSDLVIAATQWASSIDAVGSITVQGATSLDGGTFGQDVTYGSTSTAITGVTIVGGRLILTGSVPAVVTLDGTNITAVENTTGQAVTLLLANGAEIPTTLVETTNTITLVNDMAVTFTGLDPLSSLLVEDSTGATVGFYQLPAGDVVLSIPRDSHGQTWRWANKRPGFEATAGSFTVAEGQAIEIPMSYIEILTPQGPPMYTGDTDPLVTVEIDYVAPQASIDIGNGSPSLEAVFSTAENALATEAGLKWVARGGGRTATFKSVGGNFLFLSANWRLRRRDPADTNATAPAFTLSTDGVPIDDINGPIAFLTSDTPQVLAAAVRAELAVELARLDVAVSTREAETDALSRADAIDASIAALNDITTTEVRAELATELARLDVAVSTREAEIDAAARADAVDASIAALNDITTTDVRAELATELARLDVAVSTREAEIDALSRADAIDASIAALNDITTTDIRAELAVELARLDVAVSTREAEDQAELRATQAANDRTTKADATETALTAISDNLAQLDTHTAADITDALQPQLTAISDSLITTTDVRAELASELETVQAIHLLARADEVRADGEHKWLIEGTTTELMAKAYTPGPGDEDASLTGTPLPPEPEPVTGLAGAGDLTITRIDTSDGTPIEVTWPDGTTTTVASGGTASATAQPTGVTVFTATSAVTRFEGSGPWSFTMSELAAVFPDLQRLVMTNGNTTSGDVGGLPASLTTYINTGSNTTSGDIGGLPAGLTTYSNAGSNTTSGDIGGLPAGLTFYSNAGSNTTSGDIGGLPAGIAYYLNLGSNTTTYSGGRDFAALTQRFTNQGAGMTSTEIDQLLTDIAAAGVTPTGDKRIDLDGANQPRTTASDQAAATLQAAGWTVNTN